MWKLKICLYCLIALVTSLTLETNIKVNKIETVKRQWGGDTGIWAKPNPNRYWDRWRSPNSWGMYNEQLDPYSGSFDHRNGWWPISYYKRYLALLKNNNKLTNIK